MIELVAQLKVRHGLKIAVVSNEGHEPAHVHVQDGERLAKFWLEPVVLAASTGFAPRELTRIQALVTEHRSVLLEAWHEFFRP